MATNQQIVPEFKLVLVGDGGVGMFDSPFFSIIYMIVHVFR